MTIVWMLDYDRFPKDEEWLTQTYGVFETAWDAQQALKERQFEVQMTPDEDTETLMGTDQYGGVWTLYPLEVGKWYEV